MSDALNAIVSRRDAVKAAGIVGTGALLLGPASYALADAADGVGWDGEADVVVVGAGGAGDMAALECAVHGGLKTILLESLSTPISSSHLCGGEVVLCETPVEPGSREELFTDLVAAAQGDCQEDLVQAYVDIAPDVYEALVEYGVAFETTLQQAYMSHPWAHVVPGAIGVALMEQLEARIEECDNLQMLCGNRAQHLVMEDGRVAGVIAQTSEGPKRYRANLGVVIATGGFTQNPVLAKAFGRRGSESIYPLTGAGCLGDGLFMGLSAGSDVSYLGAGVAPSVTVGCESHTGTLAWMTNGAINVAMDGMRFHSEDDNYMLIGLGAMDKPGAIFFQVYDQPQRDTLGTWTGHPYFGMPLEPEIVGNTVEELASAIKEAYPDFDAETFARTVETYNGYVDAGQDADFGRTNATGLDGKLVRIEQGPFYAIATTVGTTHFNGGLKVDPSMHVVSFVDGAPIEGLYAAGEVTGGFHGYGYMSGSAFGKAVVFGLVAGRALLEDNGIERK